VLEVAGLSSGYGPIGILNDLSFEVGTGEIVAVLGHNGMGKTTLLRTLVGELHATAGHIRLGGEDITRLSMHQRAKRGIGYVPQGREIYPDLTVHENLRMGAIVTGNDGSVEQMLDHFPLLRRLLPRPGRALSGGEQQILALARCLAGRPRLLLLDEPTEGIQPSIVEQIEERLGVLAKSLELTVLVVEQDLQFIAAVANRALVMQKGRVVAQIMPGHLHDHSFIGQYLGI
jgi:branched-chain amino acid transport system ATP-binding protein